MNKPTDECISPPKSDGCSCSGDLMTRVTDGALISGLGGRSAAVGRGLDLVAGRGQGEPQQLADVGLVLGDEDARCHLRRIHQVAVVTPPTSLPTPKVTAAAPAVMS